MHCCTADDGGGFGKSEIYSSAATLKFNITFNGKPLTLMIETKSLSGASVAFDVDGFSPFRQHFGLLYPLPISHDRLSFSNTFNKL